MNIILASASPYRQELLQRLSINFKAISSHIDEEPLKKSLSHIPQQLAQKLSYKKAQQVWQAHQDSLVIGCDQVCYYQETLFSKPKTEKKATEQLLTLSGHTHQLYTAYTIIYQDQVLSHCNQTSLTMKQLSLEEITAYIKKEQPLNCAGSYMIEKMGIALFEKVLTDDYTAIIGLPLCQLTKDLQSLGVSIFNS